LFKGRDHAGDLVAGEAHSDSACMVAQFKEHGKRAEYLLVVNRDLSSPKTFTLTLRAPADSVLVVRRTDGAHVPIGTAIGTIEVRDLAPGTGELFRVVP